MVVSKPVLLAGLADVDGLFSREQLQLSQSSSFSSSTSADEQNARLVVDTSLDCSVLSPQYLKVQVETDPRRETLSLHLQQFAYLREAALNSAVRCLNLASNHINEIAANESRYTSVHAEKGKPDPRKLIGHWEAIFVAAASLIADLPLYFAHQRYRIDPQNSAFLVIDQHCDSHIREEKRMMELLLAQIFPLLLCNISTNGTNNSHVGTSGGHSRAGDRSLPSIAARSCLHRLALLLTPTYTTSSHSLDLSASVAALLALNIDRLVDYVCGALRTARYQLYLESAQDGLVAGVLRRLTVLPQSLHFALSYIRLHRSVVSVPPSSSSSSGLDICVRDALREVLTLLRDLQSPQHHKLRSSRRSRSTHHRQEQEQFDLIDLSVVRSGVQLLQTLLRHCAGVHANPQKMQETIYEDLLIRLRVPTWLISPTATSSLSSSAAVPSIEVNKRKSTDAAIPTASSLSVIKPATSSGDPVVPPTQIFCLRHLQRWLAEAERDCTLQQEEASSSGATSSLPKANDRADAVSTPVQDQRARSSSYDPDSCDDAVFASLLNFDMSLSALQYSVEGEGEEDDADEDESDTERDGKAQDATKQDQAQLESLLKQHRNSREKLQVLLSAPLLKDFVALGEDVLVMLAPILAGTTASTTTTVTTLASSSLAPAVDATAALLLAMKRMDYQNVVLDQANTSLYGNVDGKNEGKDDAVTRNKLFLPFAHRLWTQVIWPRLRELIGRSCHLLVERDSQTTSTAPATGLRPVQTLSSGGSGLMPVRKEVRRERLDIGSDSSIASSSSPASLSAPSTSLRQALSISAVTSRAIGSKNNADNSPALSSQLLSTLTLKPQNNQKTSDPSQQHTSSSEDGAAVLITCIQSFLSLCDLANLLVLLVERDAPGFLQQRLQSELWPELIALLLATLLSSSSSWWTSDNSNRQVMLQLQQSLLGTMLLWLQCGSLPSEGGLRLLALAVHNLLLSIARDNHVSTSNNSQKKKEAKGLGAKAHAVEATQQLTQQLQQRLQALGIFFSPSSSLSTSQSSASTIISLWIPLLARDLRSEETQGSRDSSVSSASSSSSASGTASLSHVVPQLVQRLMKTSDLYSKSLLTHNASSSSSSAASHADTSPPLSSTVIVSSSSSSSSSDPTILSVTRQVALDELWRKQLSTWSTAHQM